MLRLRVFLLGTLAAITTSHEPAPGPERKSLWFFRVFCGWSGDGSALWKLEAPWTVTRVDLSVTEERVDVWAGHADRVRWPCPTCGAELPVYDHAAERAWRHLDTCQFVTCVHARPPRVECPDHGVRQVRLPWAEPHARFTLLFERLAIDVLKECDIRGATRILRITGI